MKFSAYKLLWGALCGVVIGAAGIAAWRTDAAQAAFNAGIAAYDNKDFVRAAQLFGQACDGGIAQGCFNLGLLHEKGEGVAQNKPRSVQLYGQACDGGIAGGCYNLGVLYTTGEGVARSKPQAFSFWRRALRIDPNNADARNALKAYGQVP